MSRVSFLQNVQSGIRWIMPNVCAFHMKTRTGSVFPGIIPQTAVAFVAVLKNLQHTSLRHWIGYNTIPFALRFPPIHEQRCQAATCHPSYIENRKLELTHICASVCASVDPPLRISYWHDSALMILLPFSVTLPLGVDDIGTSLRMCHTQC